MSEFGNKWSSEATVKFIEQLKEKPFLWDLKHPDRYNSSTHMKGYQEIQSTMENEFPNMKLSIIDLKNKRKSLRSQYKNEIILLHTKKRSRPMLWCFEHLNFLQSAYGVEEKGEKTAKETSAPDIIKKGLKPFSRKESIKLIRELKKFPLLWNRNHKYFNDKSLRADEYHTMWLNLHKYFTLDEVKRKVKYFRRQFDLQYLKIKKLKEKGVVVHPTLWCYKELSFICPDDEYKHNDYASSHSSQLSDHSDISEREINEKDNLEMEIGSDQSEEKEDLTNRANLVEKNKNEKDPVECIQLPSKRVQNEERFKWLGNKLVQTLNQLHDENIILTTIKEVHSTISSAEAADSLILPVECASILKFRQHNNEEKPSVFHIKLAFNADNIDLNLLMAKISELPALEKLELSGNSLKKVVTS